MKIEDQQEGEAVIQGRAGVTNIIDKLFELIVSTDRRYRDATCVGCSSRLLKTKIDRLEQHAIKCRELNVVREIEVKEFLKNRAEYREKQKQKLEQTPLQTVMSKDHRDMDSIDDAIVDLVAENSLAISIVSSKAMSNLVSRLNPRYRLPDRRKFTEHLLASRASHCQKRALAYLNSCRDYTLTAEFDSWTSKAGMNILAITVTALKGNSMLLDLIDINGDKHTAAYIAAQVFDSLKDSGLPQGKFNSLISDEAANCKRARAIVQENFKPVHLLQLRCMAHLFNLIGATMSDSIQLKSTLDRLSSLVAIVGGSKKISKLLKGLGSVKLVSASPTRWYSLCGSINSALEIKPALDALPKLEDLSYSKWGPIIEDNSFWLNLEGAKIYFDRLASIIGLSESSESRLSDSFRNLLEYAKFIMVDIDQQQQFRTQAIRAFLVYFDKLDLGLLLACYALDPNHKLEWLTEEGIRESQVAVMTVLYEMYWNKVY